MIQMRSILEIADNTGARRASMIGKIGHPSRYAHVGDIIEWMNAGSVLHTVTFDNHSELNDDTLQGGGVWQVKFTVAGTYPYICTIHQPDMKGTITVT